MKRNDELGLVLDTIYACNRHFNKEFYNKTSIDYGHAFPSIAREVLKYLHTKIDTATNLFPNYLYPFFYLPDTKIPVVLEYFCNKLNCFSDLTGFLRLIESDDFFDFLFRYYFNNYPPQKTQNFDYEKIHFNILQLNETSEFKYELQYIIYCFDTVKKKLTEHIINIYELVKEIHQKFYDYINESYSYMSQNKYMDMYKDHWKCYNLHKANVSITLLHKNILLLFKKSITVILGINHTNVISKIYLSKDPSYQHLFKSCDHKVKLDIVEALSKHKELTSYELCDILNVPFATISRYIGDLHVQSIIKIRNKETSTIYYELNADYLLLLKHPVFEITC